MANLFVESKNAFRWKNIKPFGVRNQYNEMLNLVVNEYFSKQYTTSLPNFLNKNYCLTLLKFDEKCGCGTNYDNSAVILRTAANSFKEEDKNLENARNEFEIAQRNWNFEYKTFELSSVSKTAKEIAELRKLEEAIAKRSEVKKTFDAVLKALISNPALAAELGTLDKAAIEFEAKDNNFKKLEADKNLAKHLSIIKSEKLKNEYENALAVYTIAQRNFDFSPTSANQKLQADAKNTFEQVEANYKRAFSQQVANSTDNSCSDQENMTFCLPLFDYKRLRSLTQLPSDSTFNLSDLDFETSGVTVGAVVWLYYYERMGIFKILGVLMDDYNYRGKYTISGSRADKNGNVNSYSTLMDFICTMYREGTGSNLRDRICTYQRVLGVTIENNLGIESEQNTGFMQTFNRLIGYMLEYYKTKQLAQAIQSQNGLTQPR